MDQVMDIAKLNEFKDTLKAFDDFKKQATKVYKEMLFDMQKYIYSESLLNTLYIEIKSKC